MLFHVIYPHLCGSNNLGGSRTIEHFPVALNHVFTVMPAFVAGIHVFLAVLQPGKAWMAGTSPAMTTERDQT
jgi:hypothetical protein